MKKRQSKSLKTKRPKQSKRRTTRRRTKRKRTRRKQSGGVNILPQPRKRFKGFSWSFGKKKQSKPTPQSEWSPELCAKYKHIQPCGTNFVV
jgi:hypothetical protein